MYENLFVPRFDGGLNFYTHPAALQDHEWSWSNGFEPRSGAALQTGLTERITIGSDYLPASHEVVGVVPDLIDAGSGGFPCILIPTAHTASAIVRLWQIEWNGTITEKTVSGSNLLGQSQPNVRPIMTPVYFNSVQILHFGPIATSGASAIAYYNGTNFFEINPSTFDLSGQFIGVLANHIVLGKAFDNVNPWEAQIRWSDSGLHTLWDPAIDNTAGSVLLNSETGRITGMIQSTDGIVLLMDDRVILMRPTGSAPPFQFSDHSLHGYSRHFQWLVNGPSGTYMWSDGLLRNISGQPVPGAEKCALYVENPENLQPQTVDRGDHLPIVYDQRRAACVIPTPTERFYFMPDTGSWFRQVWEAQTPVAHTCARPRPIGQIDFASYNDYYYVTHTADVWREANVDPAIGRIGVVGAFVDTKDFAFNEPQSNDHINRIQIDWEPVSGAGDSLRVYAFAREDLYPSGWIGSYGGPSDFTAQFVLQGTLAANDRQLEVNLRGRYVRLRFESASGRARIRGFTIRRMRGSDRSN